MLISRFKKILWLKSRAPSKNKPEKPQINYRKHFMSTKEKQNGATLASFSISRYDNSETRHIQLKTTIWILLWSNQFWNRIANVSVQIITRKLHIKTCSTSEKAQPKTSWSCTHQDIEQKEKCLHFPSYMSEKHFGTRSMTRVNLENPIFFSSLRRSKTLLRHKHGHKRASGVFGYINIPHKRILRWTLETIEKHLTLEKNIENRIIGFQK